MDIRSAILRGADFIERNPGLHNMNIPHTHMGPNTACCILARIGQVNGIAARENHWARKVWLALGLPLVNGSEYYALMEIAEELGFRTVTLESPETAVQFMRKWAQSLSPTAAQRPTSALVADLMERVMGARIPEEA
jgi:hypothetical protein